MNMYITLAHWVLSCCMPELVKVTIVLQGGTYSWLVMVHTTLQRYDLYLSNSKLTAFTAKHCFKGKFWNWAYIIEEMLLKILSKDSFSCKIKKVKHQNMQLN